MASARLVWLLSALALLAFAAAQPAPSIALSSYLHTVGETLELSAGNLEPGASYQLVLTPPEQAGEERAAITITRQADGQGNVTFASTLQYPGAYRVQVMGPRLDASLNVQVRAAESPPADTPATSDPGTESPATDTPTTDTPTTLPPTAQDAGPGTQPGAQPDTRPDTQLGTQPGAVRGSPLPAGATVRIDGDAVVAETAAGTPLWRLDFPQGSGQTAGLARAGDRLAVGHGNHLLELSGATGEVVARHRLPAQVVETSLSANAAAVTVRYQDGSTRRVLLSGEGPSELLPFDPAPELYGWLRQEANVADAAARLRTDPTNPWLYMAQLQTSSTLGAAEADALARAALANAHTFYERAQLADALLALPAPRRDLAEAAMDAAMQDFVARGYRVELLTDEALQDAYGFPQGRLLNALGRGNLERAGFWADWLYRSSTPAMPAAQEALREYSLALQDAGRRDEASLWRQRANELRGGFQVGPTIERAAAVVGRTGWYGVAALVVSIIALHITLLAKYWRPQSLTLRRAREQGRTVAALPARLTFMRYATPLEKLVVVLLFAAALALAALQGWATQQAHLPRDWGSGTLASPAALNAVESLTTDRADALFVRGYAAQTVGNRQAAEDAYRQLGDHPAALNNLAILTDDPSALDRALALAPSDPTLLYNLGSGPNPAPLMAEYAAGEPLLVAPGANQLATAAAGTYLDAWRAAFTNPWAALTGMSGVALPAWLWTVIVVLFLAWAAVSILFLVVPRPRLARNAPRTLLYHLLALLLPGTGLADEFWGVFLMVPWAIFGVDFILHYVPGGPDPTMAWSTDAIALVVIYVLNLVAFVVEFGSYRRRMVALKQNDPQTAREYGLRVPAPDAA